MLSCRGTPHLRTSAHGVRVVGCGERRCGQLWGHRGFEMGVGDPHCCMDPRPQGAFSALTCSSGTSGPRVGGGPALSFPAHPLPPERAWPASMVALRLSPLGVPHWGQWRWGLPPRATGGSGLGGLGGLEEAGCSLGRAGQPALILGDLSARG